MTKQESKAYGILTDISVMAFDAKNILALADQFPDADELSDEFRSVLRVGIDYLHRIVQLAESMDTPEPSEDES